MFSDNLRQFIVYVFIISCYNFYNETKIRNWIQTDCGNTIFSEKLITVINHPPYFPELSSVEFFLFPTLKTDMKGKYFDNMDAHPIKYDKCIVKYSKKIFPRALQRLNESQITFIEIYEEYVEN